MRPGRLALPRHLGLLDAMILIVVLAPALVVLRERYEYFRAPGSPHVYRTVGAVATVVHSALMVLTLALAAMVLRRPRARLRMALGRPGPAACLAASAAIVAWVARVASKISSMHSWSGLHASFGVQSLYPWLVGDEVPVGYAVLGAWLMLGLARGWRPEPSPLDRAGRAVGWCWIADTLSTLALPWIEPHLPAI